MDIFGNSLAFYTQKEVFICFIILYNSISFFCVMALVICSSMILRRSDEGGYQCIISDSGKMLLNSHQQM